MKINDVRIENWTPPGFVWWRRAEDNPDEPLIEATISMKLSWREYKELLARDKPAIQAVIQTTHGIFSPNPQTPTPD